MCCFGDIFFIIINIVSVSVFVVIFLDTAHEMLKISSEGGAAETVDEGVAAAVRHGQPVGHQEDQVDVLEVVDGGSAHACNEVNMIREPTETENDHHYQQHDYSFAFLDQTFIILSNGAVTPVTYERTQQFIVFGNFKVTQAIQ